MFTPEDGIGEQRDYDLIPKNTKVAAMLKVREVKQSKAGHQMLDMELTVSRGQYKGRKVWNYQLLPMQKGMNPTASEISKVAFTRILETAGTFNPDKPESYNVFNSCTSPLDFAQKVAGAIDGTEVAVLVGIESDANYGDKNKISEWFTPNPKSHGHKGWAEVMSNDGSSPNTQNPPVASSEPAPHSLSNNDPAPAAGQPAWLG